MKGCSAYGGISKKYICPQCGRQFLVPFQTRGGGKTQWAYCVRKKRKKTFLCSYKCLNLAKSEETEVKVI